MTTGVHSTLGWVREADDEFAESAGNVTDTTQKNFGANETLQTNQGANNLQHVLSPSENTPVDTLEMMFEGSFTVSFTVTNPWWIELVLADPGAPSGTGPYDYTYSGNDPNSFQIIQGYEEANEERRLRGCVVTNATIDVTVNQPATVTINGLYADEEIVSGTLDAQPTDQYRAMTFAQGSVSVDGTTESFVQSATLSFNLGTTFVRSIGTRFAADYNPHVARPQMQVTKYMVDGDLADVEEMYGSSGATEPEEKMLNKVSATLTLDNGETGTDENSMTFTASGSLTDTYNQGGFGDPDSDLMEDINRFLESVSASATNNTSTAP